MRTGSCFGHVKDTTSEPNSQQFTAGTTFVGAVGAGAGAPYATGAPPSPFAGVGSMGTGAPPSWPPASAASAATATASASAAPANHQQLPE